MKRKITVFGGVLMAAALMAMPVMAAETEAVTDGTERVENLEESEEASAEASSEEERGNSHTRLKAGNRRNRVREAKPKVFTDEDLKKNTEKAKSYDAIIYGNEDWDDVGPAIDDKYGGLSVKDYNALVRMVYAEAGGEGEEGMLLVANVILNRMKSYKYPVTVTEVVSQAGQFQPYANGRYASVEPDEVAVRAVRRALDGENNAPGVLYFKSVRSTAVWANKTVAFRYKNHIFYY